MLGQSITECASPIRYNMVCRGCGYCLRGLPFDGTCPECGQPIVLTAALIADDIEEVYAGSHPWTDTVSWNTFTTPYRQDPHAQQIKTAASVANLPEEMLSFVRDASYFFHYALYPPGTPGFDQHTESGDIQIYAQVVLHFASAYFGHEAAQRLIAWGLGSGEGLGRAYGVLTRAGVFQLEPNMPEPPSFNGIYQLSENELK